MSQHLDPASWKALQEAPNEALLAHVAEGCDVCDAFLESLPGFDGEVDRALLALSPRPPSTDELSWARFKKKGPSTALGMSGARLRQLLAAAAVLLLAGGAWLLIPTASSHPTNSGIKGSGRVQLELRAALKAPEGTLTPVTDGARVPAGAALVFQVRSGLAGPARLYVQRGLSAPVELAQLGLVEGAQELELGEDGLLGFSLRGERGPVQLWLVAAEGPTSAEEALSAIKSGGAEGLSVAHVRVDVVDRDVP